MGRRMVDRGGAGGIGGMRSFAHFDDIETVQRGLGHALCTGARVGEPRNQQTHHTNKARQMSTISKNGREQGG